MYVKHIKYISSHEKLKCNTKYYAKGTHGSIQNSNGYCTIIVTTIVNAEGGEICF